MGRRTFFVDRMKVLRQEVGEHLGAQTKIGETELTDWIRCRVRKPESSEDVVIGRYETDPDYIVHCEAEDVNGIGFVIRSTDVLQIRQYFNGEWVDFERPLRIVGFPEPQRNRSKLVSYLIPVKGVEREG